MERPYKYMIFCEKTKAVIQKTNIAPLLHHLQTWEPTENPAIKELKQTKTVYIDMRYEIKVRLYNYLTYTKNGLSVPVYNPYKDTEIGKSKPILNF